MKKNYSEPVIQVQSVALHSLMQVTSPGEGGIKEEEFTGGDAGAKENILEGLFD